MANTTPTSVLLTAINLLIVCYDDDPKTLCELLIDLANDPTTKRKDAEQIRKIVADSGLPALV